MAQTLSGGRSGHGPDLRMPISWTCHDRSSKRVTEDRPCHIPFELLSPCESMYLDCMSFILLNLIAILLRFSMIDLENLYSSM